MIFAKRSVVGLICLITALAEGADIEPIYYQEEGRLVLPNLKVGSQSYYVELRQLEGTADFRVVESSIQARTLSDGNGTPSSPMLISLSAPNSLSSTTFNNYYHLFAESGQKIIASTVLNTPLSTQQKTRCASNPGNGETPSSYDTQIHVYDSDLKRVGGICGEDLTFEFTESGVYILHFSYGSQSAGYFNAAIL